MKPAALKDLLQSIESELGRIRTDDRYAPRTIDLDIVLCGSRVIRQDGITVPDPDLTERPFIIIPVLELDPELRMPGTGKPLASFPAAEKHEALEPLEEFSILLKERIGYEY
jgi:7,8-dihydro-6-hydroxymethylpterin-pyrophosphokinase